MARPEGKLTAARQADVADLLAAFAGGETAPDKARQDAIACYLSASEGWREASELLGGAFASRRPTSRLNTKKGE